MEIEKGTAILFCIETVASCFLMYFIFLNFVFLLRSDAKILVHGLFFYAHFSKNLPRFWEKVHRFWENVHHFWE